MRVEPTFCETDHMPPGKLRESRCGDMGSVLSPESPICRNGRFSLLLPQLPSTQAVLGTEPPRVDGEHRDERVGTVATVAVTVFYVHGHFLSTLPSNLRTGVLTVQKASILCWQSMQWSRCIFMSSMVTHPCSLQRCFSQIDCENTRIFRQW